VLNTSSGDVILSSSLEMEFIPENTVVVDIGRTAESVIPNGLLISEIEFEKLSDKTIILVCQIGSLSLSWPKS
jgi:hypothetical protein